MARKSLLRCCRQTTWLTLVAVLLQYTAAGQTLGDSLNAATPTGAGSGVAAVNRGGQFADITVVSRPEQAAPTGPPQGETPCNVVISRVVAFPSEGRTDSITLCNVGGRTCDLSGWRVTDSDMDQLSEALVFGREPCRENTTLLPAECMELIPRGSDRSESACGFGFGVSFRDEVNVFDSNDTLVDFASWSETNEGDALRRFPDGSFVSLPEDLNVVELLQKLGSFNMFLEALEPVVQTKEPATSYDIQFPWWFGSAQTIDTPSPTPAPPPPAAPAKGIPAEGPFTILAPTDAAFAEMLQLLGGHGQDLPFDVFLETPELSDILLYHIVPGAYTRTFLRNHTGLPTAQGLEVVVFRDGAMTEGSIMFHDACVDKPMADSIFNCADQLAFGKCHEPFMVSPLSAKWQGGFCQRTCDRCSCSLASGMLCADTLMGDIMASNGVVHAISRPLFPPPAFDEVNATTPAPEEEAGIELLPALALTGESNEAAVDVADSAATAAARPGAVSAALTTTGLDPEESDLSNTSILPGPALGAIDTADPVTPPATARGRGVNGRRMRI